MPKATKKRACTPVYVSPNQLTLAGFETPFEQKLSMGNRWIRMAHGIPWDNIVCHYDKLFHSKEGRPPISGRVVLGAVIVKHYLNLSDRETIAQIRENMFIQYFLGYSSFTNEEPFSPSLFVEIRERLSLEIMTKINDVVAVLCIEQEEAANPPAKEKPPDSVGPPAAQSGEPEPGAETDSPSETAQPALADPLKESEVKEPPAKKNRGRLLMDATVAPQDITFPTDLKLLNAARVKSEELIDILYRPSLHGNKKVRTYRQVARKEFLNIAKKKQKTAKEIYKANSSQIRYLKRNLDHIDTLLAAFKEKIPLDKKQYKYLLVLHTVYEQQEQMHRTHTKRIEHRIVNIHQPHVRPIVRGKESAKTEFGGKLQVSIVAGYTFIDNFSWEAFNEGGCVLTSVEKYRSRFGFYPAEVLADQIYCTRENRKQLKLLDIKLIAKPLGRPSAQAVKVHLSPGERNPVEGKFGQAKRRYGLQNVKARLSSTSQSWIAAIALVLNLVRMTRQALFALTIEITTWQEYHNTKYCPAINYSRARVWGHLSF